MIDSSITVAVISLIGTLAGSITGILVSNKLSTYRIEQLEKKLDRYVSNVDEIRERLVIVEQSAKSAHKRLDTIASQLSLRDKRNDD